MTAAPPRPHDPRDRVVVGFARDWQVRQFASDDPKLAYFAPRGMLHLQLWHPRRLASVLTPSRLTGGRFEIADRVGRLAAVRTWAEVEHRLGALAPPSDAEVIALERWHVLAREPRAVHLLRAWWATPVDRRRGVVR